MPMDPREPFQRRLSKLILERQSWVSHWKEINEYVLPRRGRFLGQVKDRSNAGAKQNQKIIDGEATRAVNTLVSGLMSGVTSPARKWFRLAMNDRDLMEHGPVKEWLDIVERVLYRIFAESNFYQVIPYVYEELAVYGTGAMQQLPDFENVVRFQAFSTGEYCLGQGHDYRVNSMYRECQMTVEQVVMMYGLHNCSQAVKDRWDKGDYDTWIDVVHLIEPNELKGGKYYGDNVVSLFGQSKANQKAFRDITYEAGGTDNKLLRTSGHDYFPVYAPRWHLQVPDVYGRGPGMEALGDVKQLQDQHKKKGIAIAKHVNPSMIADPAMKNQRMTTLPGDVTFADTSTAGGGFRPAYQVQPRLNEFLMDMQDVRERINRAFYADLFLMMANDARNQPRTATEIDERREEKLLVLGPVLQRLNHDMLDPIIDNVFARAQEVELIPDPPEELDGVPLKIDYISMMARAQQSQDILGIQDTAAYVGSLASINPDVVDKFNFDQSVDEFGELRGLPQGVIRSDDEVGELRGQRQQQQQQAMAMEQGMQAAQGAKVLSETSTTEENLLSDLMAGIGSP